ncbi:MAG: chaperone modulator CbpM [Halothiobacillaceae bacterium]
MKPGLTTTVAGQLLEEEVELSLGQLSRRCALSAEEVLLLVEEGIVEPVRGRPGPWRFDGLSLRRAQRAVTLRRDLGVNWAGAALALDLLDELAQLRRQVALMRARGH